MFPLFFSHKEVAPSYGEITFRMLVLYLVAIVAIISLGGIYLMHFKQDGVILAFLVGAIIFLITRKYYKL